MQAGQRQPARPREPFGVAELFRQSLEKAEDYRARRLRSGRRTFWTAALASILVALMCSATVGLAVFNYERQKSELELEIDALRFNERQTPAARLSLPESLLRERLKMLNDVESKPDFQSLPEEVRTYVASRRQEIADYLEYLDRISKAPQPAYLESEKDLRDLRQRLETGDLQPREEWLKTPAGLLRQELLADLDRMQDAIRELTTWFSENGRQANALATFEEPMSKRAWSLKVKGFLDRTRKVPLTGQDFLAGSQTVTPSTILNIPEVNSERKVFERNRKRLQGERDLLAALGLLEGTPELPDVLVIPEGFTLDSAGPLVKKLQQAYPKAESEFVLDDDLPKQLRQEVIATARIYDDNLLKPGRALVLSKLKDAGSGSMELQERWDSVRLWLENPKELADWRVLARLLNQLQDHPPPTDPVLALREFLQKKTFTLDLPPYITLRVPDEFTSRIPTNVSLTIKATGLAGEEKVVDYQYDSDEKRPDQTRAYRLTAQQPQRTNRVPSRRPVERLGGTDQQGEAQLGGQSFEPLPVRASIAAAPVAPDRPTGPAGHSPGGDSPSLGGWG